MLVMWPWGQHRSCRHLGAPPCSLAVHTLPSHLPTSLPAAWPLQFGLGFTSMFFDIIFMAQHYILYRLPADPNTPPATYPTEGCCGYCGSLTCACIADLAHLVADGEGGEQQEGAGAEAVADLELGSAGEESIEQQPLLQQAQPGRDGVEGGAVSGSAAARAAAPPHSFSCSCCSGAGGSGSGSGSSSGSSQ